MNNKEIFELIKANLIDFETTINLTFGWSEFRLTEDMLTFYPDKIVSDEFISVSIENDAECINSIYVHFAFDESDESSYKVNELFECEFMGNTLFLYHHYEAMD